MSSTNSPPSLALEAMEEAGQLVLFKEELRNLTEKGSNNG